MASLSKTRQQLVTQAAAYKGVKATGQDLAAEDYAIFDDCVDPVIAMLSSEGVYYVGDDDAIELDAFLPIAQIVAEWTSFGGEKNEQTIELSKRQLRLINRSGPSRSVLQVEYF
jgi:hypothetical protein